MHIPDWYLNRRACPTCGQEHSRCGDHAHGDDGKRPCQRHAPAGQWRCPDHATAAERREVVDVDEIIKAYRPIGDLMRRCAVSTKNRTYVESLEDALHRANTMVMMLSMLIETLPAKSQTREVVEGEGTPRETTRFITDIDGMVGPDHEGDMAVHPYMTLYREWTDTQGKLSKLAADLGLTERQIEVQEVQVRIMATTMSGILADLGVDLTDPGTRSIIERHLLRMETTSVETQGSLTATATAS